MSQSSTQHWPWGQHCCSCICLLCARAYDKIGSKGIMDCTHPLTCALAMTADCAPFQCALLRAQVPGQPSRGASGGASPHQHPSHLAYQHLAHSDPHGRCSILGYRWRSPTGHCHHHTVLVRRKCVTVLYFVEYGLYLIPPFAHAHCQMSLHKISMTCV
jgi:hypothetical protein